MDTNADDSLDPTPTTPDFSNMDIHDDSDMNTESKPETQEVSNDIPPFLAGIFKDDPFWDEMMAFIKAERAELDAAQK